MKMAHEALIDSKNALEPQVQRVLKLVEMDILEACSLNKTEVVTHVIVTHPSSEVRLEAYRRIQALGYYIVRESNGEYQWHSIRWSPIDPKEEKPWWKVW